MGTNRLPLIAARSSTPSPRSSGKGASRPLLWAPWRRSWSRAPLLADVLRPGHNSFGVLRLILAMAVLISHAIFLHTGSEQAEPLVAMTGYSLGQYGVQGFFVLSGILVTQSLVARGNLLDYGRARVMRIFPALVVCVLFTALLAGPALSDLAPAQYFGAPFGPGGVGAYIAQTLSLSTGSAHLPGLFARNPAAGLVNQSLWTLKYEVACYALLGAFAMLIWRLEPRRAAAGVALAMASWGAVMALRAPDLHHDGNFVDTLTYFSLFFGVGVGASLLREAIRLTWQPLAALGLLFVLTRHTAWSEPASAALLGYGLLWLSTFTFGPLRAATDANDYSYGTYIYSYPVSQALLQTWPDLGVAALIAATLALTFVLARLSWTFIERPALARVHQWRARSRPEPSGLRIFRTPGAASIRRA